MNKKNIFKADDIKAIDRNDFGKGYMYKARKKHYVPGIIYSKDYNQSVFFTYESLSQNKIFINKIYNVQLEDKHKGNSKNFLVIVKDIQIHFVSRKILHVDFLRIKQNDFLSVKLPIRIKYVYRMHPLSKIKQVLKNFQIKCKPEEIPSHIECDLSTYSLGSKVYVKDLTIPSVKSFSLVTDPNKVVFKIN